MNRTVYVCCGTGCLANNSMEVYKELKKFIEEYEVNAEVKTMIKATGCNGLCEKGPLVKIEPDNICYSKVKAKDAEEIVVKTLIQSEIIDRLLIFDITKGKKVVSHKDTDFYKYQQKTALRNIGEIDPANTADYIERGGFKALSKALTVMTPGEVIEEIEKSGLRGRGGGGFPTGHKWRQCDGFDNFPKYVICNGDEGDPGAFMDRSIMEGDPSTVIEGMTICAYAVKSNKGFIYIRDEYSLALKNMKAAIKQAEERGYLGKNIMGCGFDFDIEIVRGGGAFVCGESTALMQSIEGNVGEPRAKYIHSVERGLWGQPTVLNNVETWANIPEIIIKGSEWFNSIGTEGSKGTKVFSLVGKVKNTGLVEIPMGMTLRELIFKIGGGIIKDRKFKAVQTGGPSGGCIPENLLDIPVDFDSLKKAGSMMGSGGIIVMDERTCMVDVARYYINFLSEESCGKCVACREGIKRILVILTDICNGEGEEKDLDILEDLCYTVEGASLCGLGKTAPNPVLTTLKYFRDEYLAHIKEKRCPAGVCRNLTAFEIDKELCTSCGVCAKNCPSSAIIGKKGIPYSINPLLCIKCGNCIEVCRFNAVKITKGEMV